MNPMRHILRSALYGALLGGVGFGVVVFMSLGHASAAEMAGTGGGTALYGGLCLYGLGEGSLAQRRVGSVMAGLTTWVLLLMAGGVVSSPVGLLAVGLRASAVVTAVSWGASGLLVSLFLHRRLVLMDVSTVFPLERGPRELESPRLG